MRTCEKCGKSIVAKNAQARYCSTKCRVAAHRAAKKLPAELTSRDRWVRHDHAKRPLDAITGTPASSTDPTTWASYTEASTSTYGIGAGFVLGDGIGCIDLDNVMQDGQLDASAAIFIADYPNHYIEISPTGDGLHIWGTSPEVAGTRRTENGISVERYSTGRYITITGNIYQPGTLQPL